MKLTKHPSRPNLKILIQKLQKKIHIFIFKNQRFLKNNLPQVLSTRSPRQLVIQRSEEGFGFTLRHFIVYPPEVRHEIMIFIFCLHYNKNTKRKN